LGNFLFQKIEKYIIISLKNKIHDFPKKIAQKMTEFVQEKNTGTIPTLALACSVFLMHLQYTLALG
jgi:hypothetical protein